MQYQSGVYRQSQIIATASAHYRRYSLFGFYTYNNANGDTNGVNLACEATITCVIVPHSRESKTEAGSFEAA